MDDNPETRATSDDAPSTAHAQFLTHALEKTQANLELLLGRSVTIAPGEPRAMSGAAIKSELPPHGVILAIKSSGAVASRLVGILHHPLGLVMSSIMRLKPEAAIRERLERPAELTTGEKAGVREATSFIDAALVDFAALATGGRIKLASEATKFLPDGTELIDVADRWLLIGGDVTVAPAPPAKLLLAAPVELAEAWAAPDPKTTSIFGSRVERTQAPANGGRSAAGSAAARAGAKPDTDEPAVAIWVVGRAAFVKGVREAAGPAFSYRLFESFPELLGRVSADPRPGLVVFEVARGAEFQLDLIGALRRHPALALAGTIVALEDASRRNVLRCATLGLLDVIPLELSQPELAGRLVSRVRRVRTR